MRSKLGFSFIDDDYKFILSVLDFKFLHVFDLSAHLIDLVLMNPTKLLSAKYI